MVFFTRAVAMLIVCLLGVSSSVGAVSTAVDGLWYEETSSAIKLQAFVSWNNTIIRTRDSLQQGAQFLSAADSPQQPSHCAEVCYTHPLCNTYVFDLDPTKPVCYLFNCGEPEPNLCLYADHNGYISAEYHPNHYTDDDYDYKSFPDQIDYERVVTDSTDEDFEEENPIALNRVHKIDTTLDDGDWVTMYYGDDEDDGASEDALEQQHTTQYYSVNDDDSGPEEPVQDEHVPLPSLPETDERTPFKEPIEWESSHHDSSGPLTEKTVSVSKGGRVEIDTEEDGKMEEEDVQDDVDEIDEPIPPIVSQEDDDDDDEPIPESNEDGSLNVVTPEDEFPEGDTKDNEPDDGAPAGLLTQVLTTTEDDKHIFINPVNYNERIFRMGAILPLAFGLLFSCTLFVVLLFRCRSAKARLKQGKPSPYSHDADYLINGMYL